MITNEKMNEFCGTSDIDYQGEFALTFLMKYAVPKLGVDKIIFNGYDEWYCQLYIYEGKPRFIDFLGKPPKTKCFTGVDKDPATALRKAIEQVREEK